LTALTFFTGYIAKGERIFDGIFKMIYALAPSLGSLSLYHCNDQFQKDGGEESPTRCNKHMGKNEIQRSYSNQFQPFKRIVFSVSQANDLALKSIRDLPQANSQLAYHTAVTSSNPRRRRRDKVD